MNIKSFLEATVSAPKLLGAATVAGVGYDIHKQASNSSSMNANNIEAKRIAQIGMDISKNSGTSTMGKFFQDLYLEKRTKTDIFKFINSIGGYFKGIGTGIKDYMLPIGLAGAAILGKGCISKGGCLGLVLLGLKYTYHNILRLGNKTTF